MSTTRPYSPGDRGPEPEAAGETGGTPGLPPADVGRAVGHQSRRLNLVGAAGIVPLARDFTREALHAWGWMPADTADRRAAAEDVLLVVSELVTNACLHAEGPDELRISCDAKVLRIEVSDRGPASPHPGPRTAPAAPAGTGCSSCSACAWTGGSSGPRASPARPCGPKSGRPPDGSPWGAWGYPRFARLFARAGSHRIRRALMSSLDKVPGVP